MEFNDALDLSNFTEDTVGTEETTFSSFIQTDISSMDIWTSLSNANSTDVDSDVDSDDDIDILILRYFLDQEQSGNYRVGDLGMDNVTTMTQAIIQFADNDDSEGKEAIFDQLLLLFMSYNNFEKMGWIVRKIELLNVQDDYFNNKVYEYLLDAARYDAYRAQPARFETLVKLMQLCDEAKQSEFACKLMTLNVIAYEYFRSIFQNNISTQEYALASANARSINESLRSYSESFDQSKNHVILQSPLLNLLTTSRFKLMWFLMMNNISIPIKFGSNISVKMTYYSCALSRFAAVGMSGLFTSWFKDHTTKPVNSAVIHDDMENVEQSDNINTNTPPSTDGLSSSDIAENLHGIDAIGKTPVDAQSDSFSDIVSDAASDAAISPEEYSVGPTQEM